MDIDNFKNINDTYGHQVGDKFLIKIADLLKKNSRGSDITCRYGGEEFILVLPETEAQIAHARAEQFRAEISQVRIPHEMTQYLTSSAASDVHLNGLRTIAFSEGTAASSRSVKLML